jgi:hypothetical protein
MQGVNGGLITGGDGNNVHFVWLLCELFGKKAEDRPICGEIPINYGASR